MLDLILDLKNNKRRHADQAEALKPIKQWMKTAPHLVKTKGVCVCVCVCLYACFPLTLENLSAPGTGDHQLRMSWDDLMSIPSKGMHTLCSDRMLGSDQSLHF